jgi:hypothetical protein
MNGRDELHPCIIAQTGDPAARRFLPDRRVSWDSAVSVNTPAEYNTVMPELSRFFGIIIRMYVAY